MVISLDVCKWRGWMLGNLTRLTSIFEKCRGGAQDQCSCYLVGYMQLEVAQNPILGTGTDWVIFRSV